MKPHGERGPATPVRVVEISRSSSVPSASKSGMKEGHEPPSNASTPPRGKRQLEDREDSNGENKKIKTETDGRSIQSIAYGIVRQHETPVLISTFAAQLYHASPAAKQKIKTAGGLKSWLATLPKLHTSWSDDGKCRITMRKSLKHFMIALNGKYLV